MADDLKLPPQYRSLYRRLQRGRWTAAELKWLLAHNPKLPPLIRFAIGEKLHMLTMR